MKRISWLLALASALVVTGCSTAYDITLTTGNQITAKKKPRMVDGTYVFTDMMGREQRVPAMRVREIAPQKRGWSKDTDYRQPTR